MKAKTPFDSQLYKAAREGNINLLENHLRTDNSTPNGDSLLGVTHNGDTVLHIATYFGRLEVAKRICRENRSLLLRGNNKSETPLHYAAQAGQREIVTNFIQVAQETDKNQNALDQGDLRELLGKRNQDGETALYQAVHNNHYEVVNILINADRRLASIPNKNDVSPLYVAAMRNSLEVVNSLIESFHGTMSQGAYSGPTGQTALHAAAFGQRGIVKKILEWKPDLAAAKDNTGNTPLHYAASTNNISAVQLLLEKDKTPAYLADSDGVFPVHVAIKLGHVELVNQHFELCPDSDELLDAQGRNFLHIAVEKRQEAVVWWARKNSRIDRAINAKDDEGNTPMHLAVKARHLAIFALLLESKTLDLGIINKKGLTPFDLAAAQRTYSITIFPSRDSIIHRTLKGIRSRAVMRRRDHFLNEYKLEKNQKMEREAETYDSMARSTSTVSVLIASASFTGIFTVSGDYNAANQSSGLNLAYKAFIITVAYAFICSITATGLCMLVTMTFIDPMDRHRSLRGSLRLIQRSIRGLSMAFAFGAYIKLMPASKWLAILICLTGGAVPILINPMPRGNVVIIWSLVRFIGWKDGWTIERMLQKNGRALFMLWVDYFGVTLYVGFFIVLIIMLCSLFEISRHFLVLILVIIVLFLSILVNNELLIFGKSN